MNWTDKLYSLRTEAIFELGKIAHKYDVRNKWQESYENNTEYKYQVPFEMYFDDYYYNYSIVYFNGESFLGYSWEDGEELWFDFDILNINTICNLIDFINESD